MEGDRGGWRGMKGIEGGGGGATRLANYWQITGNEGKGLK